MKKLAFAILTVSLCVVLALFGVAQDEAACLGTEDNPILMLVPFLVSPSETVAMVAGIAEAISTATGLFIVGEPVNYREMTERFASAKAQAFGIFDASGYTSAYEATQGALVPRLAGLKDGYDYTFSSIYVRRADGYTSVTELAGGTWVHSHSATSEALPRAVFDNMGLDFAEATVGWETGALHVLLFNEGITFATGFGAPPLPLARWGGPEWTYGDKPERWIWDDDFLSLYPADVRGVCRDLRAASALPEWMGDEELRMTLTLDRILSEIGVLASFGPIPNECIAFSEGFPLGLADRITEAIVDHVVGDEGSRIWSDRRFLGWTGTKEIDDSYYDAYRDLVGISAPSEPREEPSSDDADSSEEGTQASSDTGTDVPSNTPDTSWDDATLADIPLPDGSLHRIGQGITRIVACQPSGGLVAVGTSLGIELRRVSNLQLVAFLPSKSMMVSALSFSRDGLLLAAGYENGGIWIWDLQSRGVLRTIEHDWRVTSISFDPTDHLLVAGSGVKTIKIWEVDTGLEVRTIENRRDGYAELRGFPVAFKGDGVTLATGSEDGMVKLWNYQSGDLVASVQAHDEAVVSLCFDPTGNYLLSREHRNSAAIWDATSLEMLTSFELDVRPYGATAQFSADGQHIVTPSGNKLQYLRIADGTIIGSLSDHAGEARAFSETESGDYVVVLSAEGEIFVYDARTGEVISSTSGYGSGFISITFHPDGQHLACGLADGSIQIWDTSDWTKERELLGHTGWVRALEFNPGGDRLASGCWDGAVKLWDWRAGNEMATIPVTEGRVYDVAYSPGGTTLATASNDDLVRLWDVDSQSLFLNP
jgi:WD40 repeat protein/ABC-type phosphate/phosphonate transport system substrate-binding protein